MSVDTSWRVHDLSRVPACGIRFDDAPPAWAQLRLIGEPWVVARRASAIRGWRAAGLRGERRSERCAIWIRETAIEGAVAPEDLVRQVAWQHLDRSRRALPAIAGLPVVAAILDSQVPCMAWGPTGSVGMELASGEPWVTASSDMDLMLRAPVPLAKLQAKSLYRSLSRLNPRVDVLIETPLGAVALAEWAGTDGPCMLRSERGPRLVADPWTLAGEPPRP